MNLLVVLSIASPILHRPPLVPILRSTVNGRVEDLLIPDDVFQLETSTVLSYPVCHR